MNTSDGQLRHLVDKVDGDLSLDVAGTRLLSLPSQDMDRDEGRRRC